jgi:hypothetical protein
MSRKPNPKPDDPEQSKRFVETAHKIEAGATREEFEAAFKRVAVAKRKSPVKLA